MFPEAPFKGQVNELVIRFHGWWERWDILMKCVTPCHPLLQQVSFSPWGHLFDMPVLTAQWPYNHFMILLNLVFSTEIVTP